MDSENLPPLSVALCMHSCCADKHVFTPWDGLFVLFWSQGHVDFARELERLSQQRDKIVEQQQSVATRLSDLIKKGKGHIPAAQKLQAKVSVGQWWWEWLACLVLTWQLVWSLYPCPLSLRLLCLVHLSHPSPSSPSVPSLSASVCFVWSICLSPLSLSLLWLVCLSQPSQPQFALFGPSVPTLSASVGFVRSICPKPLCLCFLLPSVPTLSASVCFNWSICPNPLSLIWLHLPRFADVSRKLGSWISQPKSPLAGCFSAESEMEMKMESGLEMSNKM